MHQQDEKGAGKMLRVTARPARRRLVRPAVVGRVLLVLAVALYLLFRIEQQIRPALLSVVEYESRRYAMDAFNAAVAENLRQNPDAYEALYTLTYAQDGSIAAVQANAYAINRLSTGLARQVEAEMNAREDSVLWIALGTLSGIQALAGRGPSLEMRVVPESYVSAQVYDTLESAGINQTKLCIYVNFSMDMSVILSGYTASVRAENDILLTQVLLVGQVPESYWSTGS